MATSTNTTGPVTLEPGPDVTVQSDPTIEEIRRLLSQQSSGSTNTGTGDINVGTTGTGTSVQAGSMPRESTTITGRTSTLNDLMNMSDGQAISSARSIEDLQALFNIRYGRSSYAFVNTPLGEFLGSVGRARAANPSATSVLGLPLFNSFIGDQGDESRALFTQMANDGKPLTEIKSALSNLAPQPAQPTQTQPTQTQPTQTQPAQPAYNDPYSAYGYIPADPAYEQYLAQNAANNPNGNQQGGYVDPMYSPYGNQQSGYVDPNAAPSNYPANQMAPPVGGKGGQTGGKGGQAPVQQQQFQQQQQPIYMINPQPTVPWDDIYNQASTAIGGKGGGQAQAPQAASAGTYSRYLPPGPAAQPASSGKGGAVGNGSGKGSGKGGSL